MSRAQCGLIFFLIWKTKARWMLTFMAPCKVTASTYKSISPWKDVNTYLLWYAFDSETRRWRTWLGNADLLLKTPVCFAKKAAVPRHFVFFYVSASISKNIPMTFSLTSTYRREYRGWGWRHSLKPRASWQTEHSFTVAIVLATPTPFLGF